MENENWNELNEKGFYKQILKPEYMKQYLVDENDVIVDMIQIDDEYLVITKKDETEAKRLAWFDAYELESTELLKYP